MLLFHGFRYDCGNIYFVAGACSMNSFQNFDDKSFALVEPKAQKQWKSQCKFIISVFSGFSIVRDSKKYEKFIKFQSSYGVTHKSISVIFIKI